MHLYPSPFCLVHPSARQRTILFNTTILEHSWDPPHRDTLRSFRLPNHPEISSFDCVSRTPRSCLRTRRHQHVSDSEWHKHGLKNNPEQPNSVPMILHDGFSFLVERCTRVSQPVYGIQQFPAMCRGHSVSSPHAHEDFSTNWRVQWRPRLSRGKPQCSQRRRRCEHRGGILWFTCRHTLRFLSHQTTTQLWA